ncbi:MAG: histidinol-phosphate transaminase [Oscillospiraceae bacterium]|nr:histidinol-phosphate transaminase [Oscillospiraceae bacterium]
MSRFLNDQFRTLEAYTPGEQPRDMQYIKLNTNESPYPPAPSVVEAMTAEQVKLLRLYSDPTAKGLKEKLAELYGVEPENVFVSNGSDEVLNFAFLAFGGQGVVFPEISYGFYEVYAQLYALEYEKIPLKDDFSIDYRDYCGKHKMVVLANPNAPTGMSLPVSQIEEIVKTNPDSLVLIDEAYVDFGGESCLPLIRKYENLLVTRTFSKSRCLAGGRLGYAFANPSIIADLEKIKYSTNPYNINRLTLLLGEKTVEAEAYYQETCAEIIRTRTWTARQLETLGFEVLPSRTNFLFAKTDKMEGGKLYESLKARGILVRHFSNPKISQYNRITIGTMEQMETFINTVKEVLYENL